MINNVPDVIYDREGNRIRVVKVREVFFKSQGRKGYILHIEREERITSVSEFQLTEVEGKYILTKDVLKNNNDL